MRALGEIAAVIAIGSLLLAAFLVPPQKSGVLDVDGYRASRTASAAAIVWAASFVRPRAADALRHVRSAVRAKRSNRPTCGPDSIRSRSPAPGAGRRSSRSFWRSAGRDVLRWWWTPLCCWSVASGH